MTVLSNLIGRLFVAWVLITALASPLFSQPPLTITDAGYFITEVGSDGVPRYVQLTLVTDLRESDRLPPLTGTGPGDHNPDASPPVAIDPPPAGISSDVAEWATAVADPVGAQRYEVLLATIRDGVKDDLVTSTTVFDTMKAAADMFVGEEWEGFRRRLGDHFAKQMQSGGLSTKEQIANELERIRYGLGYSARSSDPLEKSEGIAIIAAVNALIRKEKADAE